MDLPTDGALDRVWQYYSTDGFYKIPIGNSTFDIPAVDDLRGGMNGFPDRASVEKLRYYGIQHGGAAHGAAARPAAGSRLRGPRAARPRRRRRQADRGPGHHPPAGRLARDLRDRPGARTRPARSATRCGRPATPRRRLALAAILLVGLAYATMIQSFSWNQTSHYDLIRVAEPGQDHDRPVPGEHRRQGLLQGPLLLGPRARAGAVLAAVLRRAEPRRRRIVDARARGAAEAPGRRDDLPDRPVGERAAGPAAAAARVARGRALRAGLRRRGRGRLGLGTIVLPLSTLLFSHVFTAFLGFAAFWLMLRERDGPPSPMLLGLAGLAMGYAFGSEYPTVLRGGRARAVPALAPRRAHAAADRAPRRRLHRRRPDRDRAAAALQPLRLPLLDAPRLLRRPPPAAKASSASARPSLRVLATLLLDSRGLLTISPVLIMGALGTVLLYRRGKRAEALTIARHLRLLPGLQLRLLPALRRRLHGPALPDHDAAVPGVPDRPGAASAAPARRSRWRASRSRRP